MLKTMKNDMMKDTVHSGFYLLMIKSNKIKELKNHLLVMKMKGNISTEFKSCLYINSVKYKNYLVVETDHPSIINSVISVHYCINDICKPELEPIGLTAIHDIISSLTSATTEETFKIGDYVCVKRKQYLKYGKIQEIDLQRKKVVISIVSMGSYMPVELPLSMISRVKI